MLMPEVLREYESHLLNHEVLLNLSMYGNVYYVLFGLYYENVDDDELLHYVDESESVCLNLANFLSQRFLQ